MDRVVWEHREKLIQLRDMLNLMIESMDEWLRKNATN